MPKTFLVQPGRTVTLPQGLQAGPGATNMRLCEGAVVTFTDEQLASEHGRFINGRERWEDWKEIDPKDAPADATPAELVPNPYRQGATGDGRAVIETGKKER